MPGPPGAPPAQAPPSIPPPPPPPQATSSAKPKVSHSLAHSFIHSFIHSQDARLPVPFVQQQEETRTVVTSNPVNCPECGRHFKNNKALNGHMRLHGGFDWTKRICRVSPSPSLSLYLISAHALIKWLIVCNTRYMYMIYLIMKFVLHKPITTLILILILILILLECWHWIGFGSFVLIVVIIDSKTSTNNPTIACWHFCVFTCNVCMSM